MRRTSFVASTPGQDGSRPLGELLINLPLVIHDELATRKE